jgi:protein-disulfide isomerase
MLKKALLFILVSTFACAANAEELKNKFFNSPLFTTDSNDVVIGDAKAKVIIVEYSSLNCPHCAQFHLGPLKEIKKDYIDTGKVKYVLRDFPLNAPCIGCSKVSALRRSISVL